MKHFLDLPIGSPVFEDKDFRSGNLTLYLAENLDAPKIQFCRFYGNGGVVFGDAGWSKIPDWQGRFYPQAVRSFLVQVSGFFQKYFSEGLKVEEKINLVLWIKNISGCEREAAGVIPLARRFTYDRDIEINVQSDAKNIDSPEVLSEIYDGLIKESNLAPDKWGWASGKK